MHPLLTLVVLLLALGLLRRWLHRGLAPARTVGAATPGDRGLTYEDVRLPTANGRRLFAWFVPRAGTGPGPAAVLLHGWGGHAGDMLPLARPLHEAGYGLLLVEARCHGRSDDDSFASLPRFAEDLEHALDWLGARADVDARRLAAIGHSVGAGAVLLAASRRGELAAAVSIAAFAHPAAMMRRWLAAKGIPYRPLGWLILRYVERTIGHRFDDIAPVHTIARVRCPVLLVHGAADETVPVAEARAIHAARGGDHVVLRIVAGSHDDYGDLEREVPVLVDFLAGGSDRP